KGALVARDADILGAMGRAGLARVGISLTTLDPRLSRSMEPRAAGPSRLLAAIRALADAGCPVRVMLAPVIPAINDHEIEAILQAAREAGATSATMGVLRLPGEVAQIFRDWLDECFPDRAARVMKLVREMHGGRDHDPAFGRRMRGRGPYAALLRRRFETAAARLGYAEPAPLRLDLFRPPRPGSDRQPDLFGP
ncbi:MAG: radical SAM protein, partial [Rubrimonas sp.]